MFGYRLGLLGLFSCSARWLEQAGPRLSDTSCTRIRMGDPKTHGTIFCRSTLTARLIRNKLIFRDDLNHIISRLSPLSASRFNLIVPSAVHRRNQVY